MHDKVMTGEHRYEEMLQEQGKEKVHNMCEVLDWWIAHGKSMGEMQGITQGITQGIAQGIDKEQYNVMNRMYAHHFTLEQIAVAVGQSVEYVKQILDM